MSLRNFYRISTTKLQRASEDGGKKTSEKTTNGAPTTPQSKNKSENTTGKKKELGVLAWEITVRESFEWKMYDTKMYDTRCREFDQQIFTG